MAARVWNLAKSGAALLQSGTALQPCRFFIVAPWHSRTRVPLKRRLRRRHPESTATLVGREGVWFRRSLHAGRHGHLVELHGQRFRTFDWQCLQQQTMRWDF